MNKKDPQIPTFGSGVHDNRVQEQPYERKRSLYKRYDGSSNLIDLRKDVLDIYSLWVQITHFEDKPLFEVKTGPSVTSP